MREMDERLTPVQRAAVEVVWRMIGEIDAWHLPMLVAILRAVRLRVWMTQNEDGWLLVYAPQ